MIFNSSGAVFARHGAMCKQVAVTASVLTFISFKNPEKTPLMVTAHDLCFPAGKPGPLA